MTPREVIEAATKAAEDRVRRVPFPMRPYPVDPRPKVARESFEQRLRRLAEAVAAAKPEQTSFPLSVAPLRRGGIDY